MSMNPRQTTDKIRSDYENYISSILMVKDPEITRLAHEAVQGAEFVKGPFLESTLPFEDGCSLKELAEQGLISKEFGKMGPGVHYSEWKLRIHQQRALEHIINDKRNMVVSTGTGSGKTECYLYPVFNSLMREKEAGTLDDGVRALLIFPMNALANDQQKKLRKLLKEYPDITFGRYTGETPHKSGNETEEQAEKRLHEEYNISHMNDADPSQRESIPNELMSREQMAKTPPHILLTNYAMLEYMLLRPDTAPFFDNDSAKHWQFIVIDEAHTYKGATGTEISYLLRRLKERIRHHMHDSFRCIATSATLGSEDAKAGLAAFAQALFSEPFEAQDVITTKRKKREVPADARRFAPEEYRQLKTDTADLPEEERGAALYQSLSHDLRLFDIYKALEEKPRRIEDVAGVVFDDLKNERMREIALIDLIELAAAARRSNNDAALLPARYHLFVRSLEGMFVQLYPQKQVYLDHREKITDGANHYSVFEMANCQKCGQEYLVGKTAEGPDGDYFVQTSSAERPEYFFVSDHDENDLNVMDEDDSSEVMGRIGTLDKYHLCLCCGRITPFAEKHPADCCNVDDSGKIVIAYHLKYSGKGNESNCCPCCGSTREGLLKRFLTANQPATFAIGKSLYDALPPRPIAGGSHTKESNDLFDLDLFGDTEDMSGIEDEFPELSDNLIDESGRKLLIFSDNRQEAAFFAGFFEKKYCQVMWRKLILHILREAGQNGLRMNDLINRCMDEADRVGLYTFDTESSETLSHDMSPDQKKAMAAHYVMQEFLTPDIITGLEGQGYIHIEPLPVHLSDTAAASYGMTGQELWDVLRFMMDSLRQKGAVTYPSFIRASDDFFAPRNHAGYFKETGSEIVEGGHVFGFIPAEGSKNRRLGLMLKMVSEDKKANPALADQEARKQLKNMYELLVQKFSGKGYLTKDSLKGPGTVWLVNQGTWRMRYVQPDETLYRCSNCGKIFGYSIRGLCPEMKCQGHLEPVRAGDLNKDPYYDSLYAEPKLIPMVAREHTAQLSSATAGLYQKKFEEGNINVLSCSTTFEMGVDVGELEATFLRNVPPETSNYIQRAGRAGRRTSSAAFSVTFARRSSHDMTFFQDPARIIAGKIRVPALETGNDKIAERHLGSVVVAWFFKNHPEFFNGKAERIVAVGTEEDMATVLKAELEKHPPELMETIHTVFGKDLCEALKVENWDFIDSLAGPEGSLTRAIEERRADIQSLMEGIPSTDATNVENVNAALKSNATTRNILRTVQTLKEEKSISFLSAKGVLPKYGFPIDTVSLKIRSGNELEAKKIDLSRDLKMAISEFAPPAQVVANGKVWQSHSINIVPEKGWPTYVYYECPKCKKISPPVANMVDVMYDLKEADKKHCECSALMNARKFIIPVFGFSTLSGAKPKQVGESRPRSYYSTQTQFWGIDDLTERQKAEAREDTPLIGNKPVNIVYSPGGKLFVLNQGSGGNGLMVCPTCGYACEAGAEKRRGKHLNSSAKFCFSHNLVKVSLGHDFKTDILKIMLPSHIVKLQFPDGMEPKEQDLSVLYALLEGASDALDISRDDISGCVAGPGVLVLFDDTAGGSGYVRQIYQNFREVLQAALEKVSGSCGCTEETSCYGCLRNYSNTFYHDKISRGLAKYYLEWLLSNQEADVSNPDPVTPVTENAAPGSKTFDYREKGKGMDTGTALAMLMKGARNDETKKAVLQRLMDAANGRKLEKAIVYNKMAVEKNVLWPSVFWPESHVAIFEKPDQYEILKKYNWYCYILDQNLDAEKVLSHVKED